jgi:transposase
VALYARDHEKIAACERQIAAHLETFAACEDREALPPVSRPRQRTRNRPQLDVRGSLPRLTGVDLTAIEGIDEPTALTISSEIGLDMRRWPTVKHFASWLGLCPHHQLSGGKVLSRGTKPCANRAATALRRAASCLQRRQSALGAFCRRMQARLGTPKAITATAHKLAHLIYTLLKHGTAYVRQRLADYEHHYRDRMLQQLTRWAKALGDALVQTPAGTLA